MKQRSVPVQLTEAQLEDFLSENSAPVPAPTRVVLALVTGFVIAGVGLTTIASPFIVGVSMAVNEVVQAWEALPEELPLDQPLPQHTILLDNDDVEFARFVTENRVNVTREQINDTFADALVATEDRRFYEHGGLDLIGLARAVVSNLSGNDIQGASTITQQYVQNMLISNGNDETELLVAEGTSWQAKVQELKYASWLEQERSKEDILTGYANAVYLGNQSYGVETAAHTYFNTTAAELTIPQSALLVAMLKAPNDYDPFVHPDAALERRNFVIDNMVTGGYLSADDAETAKATDLGVNRGSVTGGCGASAYPYFCAMVQREILTDPAFGETEADRQETLRRGGLTITTTLDRSVADKAAASAFDALAADNRVATGIAIVEPGTGYVSAVAQNRTWAETQVVYATSRMQPGSVMKPVTLAAALESGFDIDTRFNANGPYTPPGFDSPEGGFRNSAGERPGTINAATAVSRSINVYFVKVAQQVGVERIAQVARRLGLEGLPTEWSGREASLAIGTYEVSPLEIATAYATFAAGGVHCDPTTISAVSYTDTGKPAPAPETHCEQVLDPGVAAQIDTVTQGTFDAGGTLAAVGKLPDRVAGGKTGTTDGSAAVWTAGMTPQYATAVWVGDPRGGQQYPLINVTAYGKKIPEAFGSSIAGPIWKATMVAILDGLPALSFGATGPVGFPSDTGRQVPNVSGMTLDAALSVLGDAGLTVELSADTAGDHRYPAGIVTGQSLAAGIELLYERSITLTLSPGSDTDVRLEQN